MAEAAEQKFVKQLLYPGKGNTPSFQKNSKVSVAYYFDILVTNWIALGFVSLQDFHTKSD